MDRQPSTRIPVSARWAWNLSLLTAFFWVVVAAAYLLRPWSAGTPISTLEWIIALLMLGNAAVIVWLGQGLRKQRRPFYYLALAYLAFNLLLTIADDFGMADLLYLLFVGTLLVILLLSKKKFMTNVDSLSRSNPQ
jgi:lysylphosphatidylglycerol synthetase-like protein (DUF2156 family)